MRDTFFSFSSFSLSLSLFTLHEKRFYISFISHECFNRLLNKNAKKQKNKNTKRKKLEFFNKNQASGKWKKRGGNCSEKEKQKIRSKPKIKFERQNLCILMLYQLNQAVLLYIACKFVNLTKLIAKWTKQIYANIRMNEQLVAASNKKPSIKIITIYIKQLLFVAVLFCFFALIAKHLHSIYIIVSQL